MSFSLKLRTISPRFIQQTPIFKQSSIRMSSSNEYGQGKSHASGESAVPESVQKVAPKGLEENLPEGVSL
jgi:hypothetical protein